MKNDTEWYDFGHLGKWSRKELENTMVGDGLGCYVRIPKIENKFRKEQKKYLKTLKKRYFFLSRKTIQKYFELWNLRHTQIKDYDLYLKTVNSIRRENVKR